MKRRASSLTAFAALAVAGLMQAPPALAQAAPGASDWKPVMPGAAASSQFLGAEASTVPMIRSRDSLLEEAASARWGLGPVRIRPELYIGNVGYTNNFYGSSEDTKGSLTASAGGGLGVVVPVGTRVFLRGGVYPGYTWYSRQTDRSTFGGTYDAQLFLFPGRFSFQLTGGFNRYATDLSSEVPQPVEQSVLDGGLAGQYELSSRTSLTGTLVLQRRTYGGRGLTPEDAERLSGLDGTNRIWSAGVRRRVGTRLVVGVSYERGRLSFVNQGSLRDADSEGVLGSAYLDRGRLQMNVYGGYRDYRPAGGSAFTPYRGPSGGAIVGYQLTRTLTLSVSGSSSLVSSIYADNAAYLERRVGASAGIALKKVSLILGYDVGVNRYLVDQALPDGSLGRRSDDVQTLRGSLSLPVYKALSVVASVFDSRYSSNVPGVGRSILTASATVSLGGGGIQLIGPARPGR